MKQKNHVNFHAWQLLCKVVFLIKHLSVLSFDLNYSPNDKQSSSSPCVHQWLWAGCMAEHSTTCNLLLGWMVHQLQGYTENPLDFSYREVGGVRCCFGLNIAFTFQCEETQVWLEYWKEVWTCSWVYLNGPCLLVVSLVFLWQCLKGRGAECHIRGLFAFGTPRSFYFLSCLCRVLSGHFSIKGARLKGKLSQGSVDLEM